MGKRQQAKNRINDIYGDIRRVVNEMRSHAQGLDDERAEILRKLEGILKVVYSSREYHEGIENIDLDGLNEYANMLNEMRGKIFCGGTRHWYTQPFPSILRDRNSVYTSPEPAFWAKGPVIPPPGAVLPLESEVPLGAEVDPARHNVRAVFNLTNNNLLIFYIQDIQTGEEKVLFEILATNNQKNRQYPTRSGNDPVVIGKNTEMKTTPNIGDKYPYIPGKFPTDTWAITSFDKMDTDDDLTFFGPYKIRTNATRYVHPWKRVNIENDDDEKYEWVEQTEELVRDDGLLIHGGGYSIGDGYSPTGNNRYQDNTEGCIRIRNEDVNMIVDKLQAYLNARRRIELKVE